MAFNATTIQDSIASGFARYVKIPSQLLLLDGLFQPRWRGLTNPGRWECQYSPTNVESKNRDKWVWGGMQPLGMLDFEVLLAVLYLMTFSSHRTTVEATWLKRAFAIPDSEQRLAPNAYGVWLRWSEIAHVMGIAPSTLGMRRIHASLERMHTTTLELKMPIMNEGRMLHVDGGASPMLRVSYAADDTARKNPAVVLHPALGRCFRVWRPGEVEGATYLERKPSVTYLDMLEHRGLVSEAARRLHAWICAWHRHDGRVSIQLDKLERHVWKKSIEHSSRYTRRQTLLDAMAELATLPEWECFEAYGEAHIKRKPFSFQRMQDEQQRALNAMAALPRRNRKRESVPMVCIDDVQPDVEPVMRMLPVLV